MIFCIIAISHTEILAQSVDFYKCNLNTLEQVESTRSLLSRSRFHSDPALDHSFYQQHMKKRSQNSIRNDAECTLIPLSIDPDIDEQVNPQTPTLNVFVKRFRATPGKNAPKALWLIMGGIGGTTIFFETAVVKALVELTKGQFDLYMMDHRGVGRSTRAGCDGSQSEMPGSYGGQKITDEEWPQCYDSFRKEWANGMHKHLNSKAGAIDVAQLITKINVPLGQKVFIYGTSYGTVQVTRFMRYLELSGRSNLVSGVILDSVISTKGSFGNGITSFDRFDAGYDFVAREILQICANVERARGDDTCLKHLGPEVKNPNYLKEFYEKLFSKNSICPEFTKYFTNTQTKYLFGELIAARGTRPLFPALIYRIKRCDAKKDAPLFKKLFDTFFIPSIDETPIQMLLMSELTQFNIALSELWDPSATKEVLDQRMKDNAAVPKDSGIEFKISQLTKWEPYQLDPLYFNHTFKTSVPVMLLNGDLDPDTPLYDAKTQASNIEGNSKGGLIVIDFATHVSLMSSPQTGSPYPCGLELLANFISMDDPNVHTMDKKCLTKLEFSFKGTRQGNLEMFGIADLYDDGEVNPDPESPDQLFKMGMTGFIILISILSITILTLTVSLTPSFRRSNNNGMDESKVVNKIRKGIYPIMSAGMSTREYLNSPVREEQERSALLNLERMNKKSGERNALADRSDAECAMIPVAIDPEVDEVTNPSTQTINLFVKRFRATRGKDASKALWLVQGGPGGANDLFEPYVNALVGATKGQFDIYMVEHRGVGRSTRAGCDGAQSETPGSDGGSFITYAEWKDCYDSFKKEWAYGKSEYLNSKAGAMDLTKMITKINVPLGQGVCVYGVSYGTLLTSRLMRYLELTGRQNMLKAVVLDGIVNAHGNYGDDFLTFDNFDVGFNYVAQQMFQLCGDVKRARGDDTCYKHFGDSVKNPNYLLDFLKKLYSNPSPCPDYTNLFTLYQTKKILSYFLVTDSTRHFMPAIIYRISRCHPKIDTTIFKSTYEKFYGAKQSSPNGGYSILMDSDHTKMNIAHSELWDPSVTKEILDLRLENSVATMGSTHDFFTIFSITNWSRYTVDPQYFNQTFTTSIPVLLLNGDLDPQTPLPFAQSLNKNIKGNTKGGLILVEFAPHATMMTSAQSGSPYPCGMELLGNFITMENPNIDTMDKSCLSRLIFTFKGQNASNMALMGTEDIYDGQLQVPEPIPPEKSALVEESTTKTDESVVKMSKIGFAVMISVLSLTIIVLGLMVLIVCVKMIMSKRQKTIKNDNMKQPLQDDMYYRR